MENPPSRPIGLAIALVVGVFLGILGQSLFSESGTDVLVNEGEKVMEDEKPASLVVERTALAKAATPREATQTASIDGGRKAIAPDINPVLGVVVYGTVRDEEGEPIESASVGFLSEAPGESNIYVSAKRGGYTVHGLKPGPWKTLIRGEGLKDTRGTADIAAEALFRLDFVVPRAYLVTVRVKTPEGGPLTKALMAAKHWRFNLNAVATQTELDTVPMTDLRYLSKFGIGQWKDAQFYTRPRDMSDDPDVLGRLELSASPPAFVSLLHKHQILASQQIVAGQKDVSFVLSVKDVLASTANIRLRVIDSTTRLPIAKARVSISNRQSSGYAGVTGEDGMVVLANQAPGLLEMGIIAKDHEAYFVRLRLSPGDVDLGTIELGPPVQAHGIVVDRAGNPQVARISWTNLDRMTFPQPLVSNRSLKSDSKGKFKLWNMGRGRYLVQARVRKKFLATSIIDSTKLGNEPFRMVLQPTHPLALDNTKMSPRRMLTALIHDAQGRLVYAYYLRGPYNIKLWLPAGTYRFEIYEGRKRMQTGSLSVSAGNSPTILVKA